MAMVPPANTREPREAHKLDDAALGRWLAEQVPGATPEIVVRQFKGGQSNPTYWVGSGDLALVLRKKPPGKLLPSAHAVEREYRIMRALKDTDVPVPDALALCEDDSVIGTPFFVMRYVPANIYWNPTLPELDSNEKRRAVYDEYVRALAALHQVDYAKVGLADYGKVGQYVARQVDRWSKQYRASETESIPDMDRLIEWLPHNVPPQGAVRIVHGDYRLDNTVVAHDRPEIIAVLDWELSTLGDPLADFSYHLMQWHMPHSESRAGTGSLVGLDLAALGLPPLSDYVDLYVARTGLDPRPHLPVYLAYNFFRIAAILQGIIGRVRDGTATSDHAPAKAAMIRPLAETAWRFAREAGAR
jgi:aminoglycoside phosphotransferase (APT) family kinase protein